MSDDKISRHITPSGVYQHALINGGNYTLGNTGTYGAPIGGGTGNSSVNGYSHPDSLNCGNITINNAIIDIKAYDAGIGTGYHSNAKDITVKNSSVTTISTMGAGIGSGQDGIVEDIYVADCYLKVHEPTSAAVAIGAGANPTAAGEVTLENVTIAYDDEPGSTEPMPYTIMNEVQKPAIVLGDPLIIHTGTKANINISCFIEDMRVNALGIADLDVSNKENANIALGALVEANYKGETPWAEATDAEKTDPKNFRMPIDDAIDYALDQATLLGSYLSRLEYTAANLTAASENTVYSESTIRDADMAKEITNFTKHNIFSQASQAMLAQANQNVSGVLGLLQ